MPRGGSAAKWPKGEKAKSESGAPDGRHAAQNLERRTKLEALARGEARRGQYKDNGPPQALSMDGNDESTAANRPPPPPQCTVQ